MGSGQDTSMGHDHGCAKLSCGIAHMPALCIALCSLMSGPAGLLCARRCHHSLVLELMHP